MIAVFVSNQSLDVRFQYVLIVAASFIRHIPECLHGRAGIFGMVQEFFEIGKELVKIAVATDAVTSDFHAEGARQHIAMVAPFTH
jgi:hypothetical protein